jgi:hypothetical protein
MKKIPVTGTNTYTDTGNHCRYPKIRYGTGTQHTKFVILDQSKNSSIEEVIIIECNQYGTGTNLETLFSHFDKRKTRLFSLTSEILYLPVASITKMYSK